MVHSSDLFTIVGLLSFFCVIVIYEWTVAVLSVKIAHRSDCESGGMPSYR